MEIADRKNSAEYLTRSLNIKVPFDLIAQVVAEHYGVTEEKIFERNRKFEILVVRYTFMALARKMNYYASYHQIGYYCKLQYGLRHYNHASVINACDEAENLYKLNKAFKTNYNIIKSKIEERLQILQGDDSDLPKLKEEVILQVLASRGINEMKEKILAILDKQEVENLREVC